MKINFENKFDGKVDMKFYRFIFKQIFSRRGHFFI